MLIEEKNKPVYPEMKRLEKYRRAARNGAFYNPEYGNAVLAEIRSLQLSALERQLTPLPSSRYVSGKELLRRIKDGHARSLDNAVAESWRKRKEYDVKLEYQRLMGDKRKREKDCDSRNRSDNKAD
jgi:hypothetical protein